MTDLRAWLESHPIGERGDALMRLAKAAGVTTDAAARHWINGTRSVPPERVLAVEAFTGVSRHAIRPDVYGPAPNAAA